MSSDSNFCRTHKMTPNLFGEHDCEARWATFSEDRKYRYELGRAWNHCDGMRHRMLNFLMLNPSTADENVNDPTVQRCERRARTLGYSGMIVTNLFAFRSTDPRGMLDSDDPIGPENDACIVSAAAKCGMTICAWGKYGLFLWRSANVARMLTEAGVALWCLRQLPSGDPGHPLYLPYACEPIRLNLDLLPRPRATPNA